MSSSSSLIERLAIPGTSRVSKLYRGLQLKLRRKPVHRRAVRLGLLLTNVAILVAIAMFIVNEPKPAPSTAPLLTGSQRMKVTNPLDQVSSADIALTVARLGNLPETTAVSSQAQSQAAEIAVATSSNNVVNKPQVVATALKSSADIKDYVVQSGDTVTSVATKFGITSDSIRWSNGLSGEALNAGAKLVIPPVNGVVYTVNSNDTPDSLASRFKSSKEKIIAYNDAEIGGLVVGRRILIPDGVQTLAPQGRSNAVAGRSAFAWLGGGGSYDYGYCTWYAAKRLGVPGGWGNANTWDYYAPHSGWKVGRAPVPGAVGQNKKGRYGHVVVIDAVSADGQMVKYSDMNGLRGWGREGSTADWVPADRFVNYIYR